jgi:hypothetical protein
MSSLPDRVLAEGAGLLLGESPRAASPFSPATARPAIDRHKAIKRLPPIVCRDSTDGIVADFLRFHNSRQAFDAQAENHR